MSLATRTELKLSSIEVGFISLSANESVRILLVYPNNATSRIQLLEYNYNCNYGHELQTRLYRVQEGSDIRQLAAFSVSVRCAYSSTKLVSLAERGSAHPACRNHLPFDLCGMITMGMPHGGWKQFAVRIVTKKEASGKQTSSRN